MRKLADELQEEWELFMNRHDALVTCTWISSNLLRPFLLFSTHSSRLQHMLYARNTKQISFCFKILLRSINSAGKAFIQSWTRLVLHRILTNELIISKF